MLKRLVLFFLIVVALLGAGVFFLLKPKSLGISYTEADYESINKKLGVTFETPVGSAQDKSLIVTGSHKVDQSFSSEELTAVSDKRGEIYPAFPFRNVQIRVNADQSVEGSATVNYKDIFSYLSALGFSSEDIARGAEEFKLPSTNIPVYLRVSGNITKNESNITVLDAKISALSISEDLIRKYAPLLNPLVEKIIEDRSPSYDIEKLEVVSGKIHFVGSAPDKEIVKR